MKIRHTKSMGMQRKQYQEGKVQLYRPTPRNLKNLKSNLTSKRTIKRRMKPKVSRRQELIKIKAEICEIDTKKTIGKTDEIRRCSFEKINKTDKTFASLRKKERRI